MANDRIDNNKVASLQFAPFKAHTKIIIIIIIHHQDEKEKKTGEGEKEEEKKLHLNVCQFR